MNNEQFRKLAFGSGSSVPASSSNGPLSSTPRALGSRQKASIPMTPRHGDVGRVAFARQMAERYGTNNNEAAIDTKQKVRTAKPRGTQFAAGYVDRAKLRTETEKLDGETQAVNTTSKGLDFLQLERARRGDVEVGDRLEEEDGTARREEAGADVDDEFERIETADIQAIEHVKSKKKGQFSTAPPAAGQKRSRDQILAEMKAAREAAKQAKIEQSLSQPALGSRFKKIGTATQAGSRIEVDSRGREVLILVDENGHEKRKVRKVKNPAPTEEKLDGNGKVLGMEVPEFYRKKLEAEAAAAAAKEVDIFDDVGSDYDPLAGMDSDSSDGEADKEADESKKTTKHGSSQSDGMASDVSRSSHSRYRPPIEGSKGSTKGNIPQDGTPAPLPRQNYFGASTLLSDTKSHSGPLLQDPSVLGALRKAKQMREASEAEAQTQALSEEAAREARLQKLLQSSERDAEDLDMGFGSSRLEDTEDLDEAAAGGKKVRLSTWKGGTGGERQQIDGDDDDDDAGGSRGDKSKRKRGAKKRKGDGNNAEDVMRVLERRREQERP